MLMLTQNILLLRVAVLILLCSTFGSTVCSQERAKVRARISTDKNAKDSRIPMALIRSSPNYFMAYRGWDSGMAPRAFQSIVPKLDLYDLDKLTFVRSQNLEEKLGSQKLYIEDLVYFSGGPRLIGTVREPAQGEVHFYQALVDPALSRSPAPYEKIVSFDGLKVRGNKAVIVGGGALRSQFSIFIAPDTSHMFIVSPELRDKDSGNAVYMMVMLDSEMNVKWQQVVDVDANTYNSRAMDAIVDEHGNAYLLVKNNTKIRDVSKKGDINFEMKLYHVTHSSITETRLGLGNEKYIQSAMLRNLSDGRVVCSGLFGNVDSGSHTTTGYFAAYVDPGDDVISELTTFGYAGENSENGQAAHMEMVDLLPCSDGGFFMVSEYFRSFDYVEQSGRAATRWVHGPVNVMRIDSDGTSRYTSTFQRVHYSGSPVLGNVYPVVFENELFIFLIDSDKLAEKRKAGKGRMMNTDMKKPYTVYVYFDEDGKYRTKPVMRTDRNSDFISGWKLYRVGPDQYIATGTEKLISGKFVPVRIELSH